MRRREKEESKAFLSREISGQQILRVILLENFVKNIQFAYFFADYNVIITYSNW
jgi:hypothetical protein